jgi:hypothetical protein
VIGCYHEMERRAISSPRNGSRSDVKNTVALLMGEVWIWHMAAVVAGGRASGIYLWDSRPNGTLGVPALSEIPDICVPIMR